MSSLPLVWQGRPGHALLASCHSGGKGTPGGLYSFDGRDLDLVDPLSCTGLFATNDQFFRLLWTDHTPTEVLTYDRLGVRRYARIDDVAEPHDTLWDGEQLVVVSTGTNAISWTSPSGDLTRTWQGDGLGDAWHVNCLCLHEGQLYASAFGRYRYDRQWSDEGRSATGMVFNVATGEDVLTGLVRPHNPRFFDGAWVVCNSGERELAQFDPADGRVTRRLPLQGWTRGLALTDDYVFVGVSANRNQLANGAHARVAVVCRRTWQVLQWIGLPCAEVYDLVVVSGELLSGIRQGFRTNAVRVGEENQRLLFEQAGIKPVRVWATADPLPPEACRVRIEAELPEALEAEAVTSVPCDVKNLGGTTLVGSPPHPVHLYCKWFPAGAEDFLREETPTYTKLPLSLPPGQQVRCMLKIKAPPRPGTWILRVTAVQVDVRYFDEVDPGSALERTVEVLPSARVRTDRVDGPDRLPARGPGSVTRSLAGSLVRRIPGASRLARFWQKTWARLRSRPGQSPTGKAA